MIPPMCQTCGQVLSVEPRQPYDTVPAAELTITIMGTGTPTGTIAAPVNTP